MEQQPENAKSPEIIDPNPGGGVESHGGSEPTTSLTASSHPTATKWCSPKAGQSGFSLVCNSMGTKVVSCPGEYFTCQQQQLLELLQPPVLWRLAAAFDDNTGAGQTPGGYIDV